MPDTPKAIDKTPAPTLAKTLKVKALETVEIGGIPFVVESFDNFRITLTAPEGVMIIGE